MINNVNLDLQRYSTLGKWAHRWGMHFQPSKCHVFRISKKCALRIHFRKFSTRFCSIKQITGVTIASGLNWSKHVSNICTKTYRTLGLLKRNLSQCSPEVRLQAYKGLVRPVLEYVSTAWDPHQQYLKDQIENVQKRSARCISSNYNYDPGSMTTILKQLNLPSLSERRR